MRQRKANENAVEKTIAFLNGVKLLNEKGGSFNVSKLQSECGISNSTFSVCKDLGFIKDSKLIVDADRINALQVLEVLRQKASKRIDVALSPDFTTAIERLTNSMNTLSFQNERVLKSPLLSRALNQAEQTNGNTLFTQIESEQDKKFELLKAIAGGWFAQSDFITPYEQVNDKILGATEDLFNKFFSKK